MHIVRGTHGSIQALAVPYLVVWGTLPQLGHSAQACSRVWRSMYPASATLALMAVLLKRAMRALLQMHTALRDSLYLVGRRLHNNRHKFGHHHQRNHQHIVLILQKMEKAK